MDHIHHRNLHSYENASERRLVKGGSGRRYSFPRFLFFPRHMTLSLTVHGWSKLVNRTQERMNDSLWSRPGFPIFHFCVIIRTTSTTFMTSVSSRENAKVRTVDPRFTRSYGHRLIRTLDTRAGHFSLTQVTGSYTKLTPLRTLGICTLYILICHLPKTEYISKIPTEYSNRSRCTMHV